LQKHARALTAAKLWSIRQSLVSPAPKTHV
jgi:hypothetical protein